MIKPITCAILIIICLTQKSTSQTLSPEVTKAFPAHILQRFVGLSEKVPLTTQRQFEIARYFKRQDSLANLARLKGVPLSDVFKFYAKDTDEIKQLLTPLEYSDYTFVSETYSSKFASALKHREKLLLSNTQIDSLLMFSNKLNSLLLSGDEWHKYVNDRVLKTLTDSQTTVLLQQISLRKARQNADKNWFRYTQSGITKDLDSVKVMDELVRFEAAKLAADERLKMEKTPANAVARSAAYSNVPLIIRKLEKDSKGLAGGSGNRATQW